VIFPREEEQRKKKETFGEGNASFSLVDSSNLLPAEKEEGKKTLTSKKGYLRMGKRGKCSKEYISQTLLLSNEKGERLCCRVKREEREGLSLVIGGNPIRSNGKKNANFG